MGDTASAPSGPDLTLGAAVADIPEGGMLAGHVGDEAVLLSRSGDQVFAVSGACTHYGGPLAEGLAHDGHVHCLWHHACFDLATGEARAAPAFAPLQRWRVELKDGLAFARDPAPEAAPAPRRTGAGEPGRIVIVGGGAAGFAAADRLRHLGFSGALTLLSADTRAPYDRPNLSKDYLAGTAEEAWMPLKDDAWYAERSIDLKLGETVGRIDADARMVETASGARHGYDALLLATGCEPIRLPVPGFDHAQVRALRSMGDCEAIIVLAATARRAVVVGASFIGLETAAALRHRGLEVRVVAPEAVPMERILGRELGLAIKAVHEANGVVFHLERKPAGFDGRELTLDDGARVAADLVIVGVGVRPRTDLAAEAGLAVDKGVVVDVGLRTSRPGIFAAGDIALYPHPHSGAPTRVEHWVVAERQGQVAAANMLGGQSRFTEAPFFWSNHYDLQVHYVGVGAGWDRAEVDGDIAARDATVRYFAGARLIAAASLGRDLENLVLAQQLGMAA